VTDTQPEQRAEVHGGRSVEEVAAYLPSNYQVTGTRVDEDGHLVVQIAGTDYARFTLHEYVAVRLASGLMRCKAVRDPQPVTVEVRYARSGATLAALLPPGWKVTDTYLTTDKIRVHMIVGPPEDFFMVGDTLTPLLREHGMWSQMVIDRTPGPWPPPFEGDHVPMLVDEYSRVCYFCGLDFIGDPTVGPLAEVCPGPKPIKQPPPYNEPPYNP
jgi:hypothetical protein